MTHIFLLFTQREFTEGILSDKIYILSVYFISKKAFLKHLNGKKMLFESAKRLKVKLKTGLFLLLCDQGVS